MADEACVVRLARNRERTQTENRSNEQPQNQHRTIILTMSWFQISNSTYMIFPANQRPCQLFLWCCSDWLSIPPFIRNYLTFASLNYSTGAQQNFFPHTQGLLKYAVYGLKYYGWATREKLYHSYPTTYTSLVPSHYETEPSASRI